MTRRMLFIALVAALVQFVPSSSVSALSPPRATARTNSFNSEGPRPTGQWSMFMNGPLRRGRTPIVGAQSSNLAWRISTETNGGGPAVGRDGTIYQGTDFGQLLALSPEGSVKWTVSTPDRVSSSPAILLDGRIAFVDEGGNVFVLYPDGSLSWEFQTGTSFASPSSSPAIGRDGTIYTGISTTVYAFTPTAPSAGPTASGAEPSPDRSRSNPTAPCTARPAGCSPWTITEPCCGRRPYPSAVWAEPRRWLRTAPST